MKKLAAWQREAPRASAYTLHDLSPGRAGDCLLDSSRLDIAFINGSFAHNVLYNKLLFTKLTGKVLTVPKVVALLERGEIYAEGQATTLRELVSTHRSLILKPSGELMVRASTASSCAHKASWQEVATFSRTLDTYLVTPKQAAYARTVCAETTNSVRVVTLPLPTRTPTSRSSATRRTVSVPQRRARPTTGRAAGSAVTSI